VHSIVTKSALENVQDEMSPINHSVGCNYPHEKLLCLSKERNGIRIKKMFFIQCLMESNQPATKNLFAKMIVSWKG
jgi:hypothetical protein